MPRTREENERIRQAASDRIRTAAMEIFIERGYHHASIDDIASRAGVSKGLLYNYFKGKEALLASMVQYRIDQINEVMQSAANLTDPTEQLRSIVDGAMDGVREQPDVYRFYLHLQTQPAEDKVLFKYSEQLKQATSDHFEIQCRLFENLGAADARLQSLYFSSTLTGMMLMIATYPEGYPVQAMKEQIMDQFCPK
ncbi:TetR/AcrR family transcriptional regulator [Paenibacillus daejeonensis]|uniref:TetR/AcrR family transcriptional regulator n=1 Tax=Paenibacillus daejeonensis TaxID=135193 RepID=UPI00036B2B86|nr:TetR/AcrR family transcriptional regulator [Paenibacillus daejeonensis]